MSRILAIDHGTKLVGWALIVDGIPLGYGTVRLIPIYPDTLTALKRVVERLIYQAKPDVVALEKPMSMLNGETARKLIEHYAVAKIEALERGIELFEVAPTTLKLIVAGAGNADKQAVAESICIKYGIDLEDLCPAEVYKVGKRKGQVKSRLWDASDAVAIGLAAWELIQRNEVTKNDEQSANS